MHWPSGLALTLLTLLQPRGTARMRVGDDASELADKAGRAESVDQSRIEQPAGDVRFAVVSDRTGGHRPGIFTRAVRMINMLQPEFVMSVGDLIEGYSTDPGQWALEWSEFESNVDALQMPFFLHRQP